MIRIVSTITLMLFFGACGGDKLELYDRMTKIDAHVHIRTSDPAVMGFVASEGFKLLTICTRSDSQAGVIK